MKYIITILIIFSIGCSKNHTVTIERTFNDNFVDTITVATFSEVNSVHKDIYIDGCYKVYGACNLHKCETYHIGCDIKSIRVISIDGI